MIKNFISKINVILITILLILNAANAETEYNYSTLNKKCAVYDPYEYYNRKVFYFNGVLDTIILRPIAKGYGKLTNNYIKTRVGSFVGNYSEPFSMVNYSFQGKGEGALKTFWRFTINSTVGILGIFDVASKFGLNAEPQTFENTLAYHGVGPGAYLMLPFFGSTTARGMMDPIALTSSLNPVTYFVHSDFSKVRAGINLVYKRDKVMPFTDHIAKHSLDPYVAIREAYINSTESKMAYKENFVCPVVK